ncbi:hypothetical protein CROQUDRAFT_88937 [Cronartium quercuum f. sp. fusiforme G11]|uniref:Alpha-amylase n=1 Tax=Cronartium quercuum f. sp. fusiforme G11 TaxID=708437 RepID=A0A9P6NSU2_9BASI|nr:hypothetical protein CROQUDRAFT_88937 [Cronartium quercuum f. sp. fusiforme G11]
MKLGRFIEFQQLGLNQAESKSFWMLVFTPNINTGSAAGSGSESVALSIPLHVDSYIDLAPPGPELPSSAFFDGSSPSSRLGLSTSRPTDSSLFTGRSDRELRKSGNYGSLFGPCPGNALLSRSRLMASPRLVVCLHGPKQSEAKGSSSYKEKELNVRHTMIRSVSFSARYSSRSGSSTRSFSCSSTQSSSIISKRQLTLALGGIVLALRLLLHNPHPFQRDVTVQLFQWSHNDVANECEYYLGPLGYRWVQVSPPQEHIAGNTWWSDYQAVSYLLTSKHGNEDEFATMVKRCNEAGVGVIVDAVINHMTAGLTPGPGTAGSSHSHYEYPDLYTSDDFHHCQRNGNDHIADYKDRWEVHNCELVGLADLATETPKVRKTLGAYLDKLSRMGVSGFRIDAAKHMPTVDIQAILRLVTNGENVRIVQEVFFGATDAIRPEEYMINGNVHMFQGASDLKRMFSDEGISYLTQPIPWGQGWGEGYLPSSHSQVFVTNHDLERQPGTGLEPASPHYILAYAFVLTWPYGQIDIFSGYNFTSFDDGPPAGPDSSSISAMTTHPPFNCTRSGWRCEHRHPTLLGAIKIRGIAGSQRVRNILTSGTQRIAYGRGSKAFVVINNQADTWTISPGTMIGMKPGVYAK